MPLQVAKYRRRCKLCHAAILPGEEYRNGSLRERMAHKDCAERAMSEQRALVRDPDAGTLDGPDEADEQRRLL